MAAPEDYNEPCRVQSPLWVSAPCTVGYYLLLKFQTVPPLPFHSRSHLRTKSASLGYHTLDSTTRNSYWWKKIFLGQQKWTEGKETSQFNSDKLLVWFCHKLCFAKTDSYGYPTFLLPTETKLETDRICQIKQHLQQTAFLARVTTKKVGELKELSICYKLQRDFITFSRRTNIRMPQIVSNTPNEFNTLKK